MKFLLELIQQRSSTACTSACQVFGLAHHLSHSESVCRIPGQTNRHNRLSQEPTHSTLHTPNNKEALNQKRARAKRQMRPRRIPSSHGPEGAWAQVFKVHVLEPWALESRRPRDEICRPPLWGQPAAREFCMSSNSMSTCLAAICYC